MLVRPHPPREEEEKIVQVAVLRATCRSMMMMTVLLKGFVSSTDDDDDTRRRRKRMETQTALLRRRVPPRQFSFLGFYKTLNFRHPLYKRFWLFVFWERTRPSLSSHFVYRSGRKVLRDDSLFLSLSLSHEQRAFSRLSSNRGFLVGLCANAREKVVVPACEGRELAHPWALLFFFRSSRGVFGALSLSFSLWMKGRGSVWAER